MKMIQNAIIKGLTLTQEVFTFAAVVAGAARGLVDEDWRNFNDEETYCWPESLPDGVVRLNDPQEDWE